VQRLHILAGLLIAYLNIDEVIRIIRTEDAPKPVLMKRFKLSDAQAEAILELKLRHLAKLEEIKIRAEQEELARERDTLEKTLNSKAKLKRLIRDELLSDTEEFGDPRRTPIVERQVARAMDQSQLVASEPTTVVLSKQGWVRAAKGHEVDPRSLSYRSGDAYLHAARGKSTQLVAVLDSTGRTYSVSAHSLPSARGQGEPLSSSLSPPSGATFAGVMMGEESDLYILASDLGYAFIAALAELHSKNRKGKATLRVPAGASALTPQRVYDIDEDWLAVITSAGYLLVYAATELPRLNRGKGVKLINIPSTKLKAREETVVGIATFQEGEELLVHAGKRYLRLKPGDIDHYVGARGKRGRKLPRGFQQVRGIEAAQ